MEMQVPFWTDSEDVTVCLHPHSLEITIGSSLHVVRRCWSYRCCQ